MKNYKSKDNRGDDRFDNKLKYHIYKVYKLFFAMNKLIVVPSQKDPFIPKHIANRATKAGVHGLKRIR